MNRHDKIKAKGHPEWTTLYDHLSHVKLTIRKMAQHLDFDLEIAEIGAILHDIGKAHPIFQARLTGEKSSQTFRHEIASLFFLPLVDEPYKEAIIEMVIAHHKSVYRDPRQKGLLDLERHEADVLPYHLGNWEEWSPTALDILQAMGIETRKISLEEAKDAFQFVIDYSKKCVKGKRGFSEWRGLLMGADHFASAMIDQTENQLQRLYHKPILTFFNRQHPLYPLSYYSVHSEKPHTIVVASTGAGKTDFLFRRCKGRVFYTLPFQASINAMYFRLFNDLSPSNPDLDIRVLHAASSLIEKEDGSKEDIVLQRQPGSAIKVLTPYQLAGITLASKGYEAMILDIKGCDIILDEVHTYSAVSQAIVLKLIEVLKNFGCRIHVGTATMPTVLYQRIVRLLGKEMVLETKLSEQELDGFNRHTVHKLPNWSSVNDLISEALDRNEKVLVVCNQVQKAQETYQHIQSTFPGIPLLLLHSKMKRKDREIRERQLLGLNVQGQATTQFNTSQKACIVVSTQVVEVSLDISFDLMITECAPLDALIQRFGRINRKRYRDTIGQTKPVYVIAPPKESKEVRPYELNTLEKTFEVLPDGDKLEERTLQEKIDIVFPEIDEVAIESFTAFQKGGSWKVAPLTNGTGWLVDLLQIDSVTAIVDSDYELYRNGNFQERMEIEIPVRYWSVKDLPKLEFGNGPYVIPKEAYDDDLGLVTARLKAPHSSNLIL